MKKLLCFIVIMILVLSIDASTYSIENVSKLYYEDKPVNYHVAPTFINGELMVPLVNTFKTIGASVSYNAEIQGYIVNKDDTKLIFYMNKSIVSYNETEIDMKIKPQVFNKVTMIPVNTLYKFFFKNIEFTEKENRVNIYDPLYPILQNGKWGFINSRGEIKIKPQFDTLCDGPSYPISTTDKLRSFENGLESVKVEEKMGYINRKGEIVIPLKFQYASPFNKGIAEIEIIENGIEKRGIIDTKGSFLIAPQANVHFNIDFYNEGLLPKWESVDNWVRAGLYSYIDIYGNTIIKPKFDDARSFIDGIASVAWYDKAGYYKISYINQEGEILFKGYERYFKQDFRDGLAAMYLWSPIAENQRITFIDRSGKIVIPLMKGWSLGFSEGLCALRTNSQYGYIDKKGKFVVKTYYDYAYHLSEGLGIVRKGSSYGAVNRQGKVVIEPKFNWLSQFYENKAIMNVDGVSDDSRCRHGKYGFINKKGEVIIPPKFDGANRFVDGIARVYMNSDNANENFKIGYIDIKGNYIWEPTN